MSKGKEKRAAAVAVATPEMPGTPEPKAKMKLKTKPSLSVRGHNAAKLLKMLFTQVQRVPMQAQHVPTDEEVFSLLKRATMVFIEAAPDCSSWSWTEQGDLFRAIVERKPGLVRRLDEARHPVARLIRSRLDHGTKLIVAGEEPASWSMTFAALR